MAEEERLHFFDGKIDFYKEGMKSGEKYLHQGIISNLNAAFLVEGKGDPAENFRRGFLRGVKEAFMEITESMRAGNEGDAPNETSF